MDEESRAQFEADLRGLAQTGALSNRDYFINPASGLEKTAVRLTGIREEGDRYLFVLRNQTVHLQLLKVLEERSAQLNALLASTHGIVFSIVLSRGKFGAIDNVSQYLSQKMGYSQDELTRMQFKDLFVDTKATKKAALLAQAQKKLAEEGTTTFVGTLACKDESRFEAQVTITALDLPGQDGALVVLRDISTERDNWSRTSKEAQELQSVRSALPGMYLKTDSTGKVLEVYSNLPYLSQEEATNLFMGKKPEKFWKKDAAQQALFTIKEALSINVSTNFDLEWKLKDVMRYFNVSVTPIASRGEVVLWLKDVSQGRSHEEQVRQLYALTSDPGLSMTQQVDKILEFGLKTFHADVGFVLRFTREAQKLASHVMYVTPNDIQLEKSMSFPVEECLYDVGDGRVLLWPDMADMSCHNCVHIKKDFHSLLAAPLLVNGKMLGALCFASQTSRRGFDSGTEELMGLLGRMLAMRIELRQTGKMLSEASRSFARTLEYVDKPAALFDLDYQITFINEALLEYSGRHIDNMLGRDFFEELVRNADLSKRAFKDAVRSAEGNSLHISLEVRTKKGTYEEKNWQVVLCKDEKGEVASYGLMEVE
jgi:PAS domain-containing protein